MTDLPVLAGNTQRVDSDNSSFAEGFIKTLNAQSQTLVELKNSSLGILKATLSMKDTLEANASAANLDSSTVEGNIQQEKNDGLSGKFSDMLDSMQDAFDGLGGGAKSLLGIGALLAGLALLNTFSEELTEMIAPILKFFNESFLPNLKELNQIILDQPGGYLTLLGAAGLTKTMFDIFGKGGKIAKVIDDTVDGVKVLKQADLLDDLAVRKVGWATRLRTAFTGRLTGLFGRIGGIFGSIGASLRALGVALVDDIGLALKNLTPTWLRVLKLRLVGGETIYPITKGGGKQIGLVGKVSQGIQKIVAAIKGLNPFSKIATSLKTLGASWKLALSGAMFGAAGGPAGAAAGGQGLIGKSTSAISKVTTSIKNLNPFKNTAATLKTLGTGWSSALKGALYGSAGGAAGKGSVGVITKVTNAIARIANVVKGIFSPTSILGRFTGRIRGIFAIIAKALGFVSKMSGLTSFLKLGLSLGKAIPIVGQIIMVLTGIFGFITGAIKGFKTGGILGAIKGGLIGLYDGLIGSFLNLIADVIGWVFKKLGFKRFGEWFGNLDFSFDGIMNGIMFVVDKIRYITWYVTNMLKQGYNKVQGWLAKVPGFGWMKPAETPAFVPLAGNLPAAEESASLQEGAGAEGMDLEGPSATRIDVASFDANDVANVDYTNSMDAGEIDAVFADQGPAVITVTDAEAEAKLGDLYDENRFKDDGQGSAIAAEAMREADLQVEKDMQLYYDGGGTPMIINDNSSKSQMNNTQMVSTGLSVDATDLVAAKLNMMLPAFN